MVVGTFRTRHARIGTRASSALALAIDSFHSRNTRESNMRHLTDLRTLALAASAAAALSFNAVADDMDETYWYASGDPTVPDGQLWVTSYGECWQSAPPDGPTNLPPCQVMSPPLVLRINFALDRFGLDDIVNPEALADLDAYIDEVNDSARDEVLSVVGHTDKLGSFEHNLTLSENRAQTIVDYMVDRGVSRDRIQTVKGVAWEGGNDVDAEGNVIDLGPLENNPIRRRTVVTELLPPQS
jgi:OOP family OmpA-OmpF porin